MRTARTTPTGQGKKGCLTAMSAAQPSVPQRGERSVLVSEAGVQLQRLEGTDRLHLNHGPIDLILDLQGSQQAILEAEHQAAIFMETVLQTLMDEIIDLRTSYAQLRAQYRLPLTGPVACRMGEALYGYRDDFVTPMAAVAGSVADELLDQLHEIEGLTRILINNGGDMAFWLGHDAHLQIGVVSNPTLSGLPTSVAQLDLDGQMVRELGLGGVATSGWQGRSHSLGIADSVTVLADSAARADVAATMIANAVDLTGSPKIIRQKANELAPDSDLGELPVTVAVAPLTDFEAKVALQAGCRQAQQIIQRAGAISAFLSLQGHNAVVGNPLAREEAILSSDRPKQQ